MFNITSFEIFLFLFVFFTSGLFYIPINRWEVKIAKRNNEKLKIQFMKKKLKLRAVKNLKNTSHKLSSALHAN